MLTSPIGDWSFYENKKCKEINELCASIMEDIINHRNFLNNTATANYNATVDNKNIEELETTVLITQNGSICNFCHIKDSEERI